MGIQISKTAQERLRPKDRIVRKSFEPICKVSRPIQQRSEIAAAQQIIDCDRGGARRLALVVDNLQQLEALLDGMPADARSARASVLCASQKGVVS
jgi:hypothetical protein